MDKQSHSIEVSARSVDEAIQRALQQLGLGRDEVEVEVIRQGSRGLLGLRSEEAIVRVTPKMPTTSAEVASKPIPAEEQEEIAKLGIKIVENLLSRMGLRARVAREDIPSQDQQSADTVLLNVSGEGLGVLIGRRGETLRDLQFLTCLLISRHTQRWPKLIVDVEHYRSRREKSLIDLARRMAEKVRTTARPVSLEPMPPHERRIVHLALRDDPDVFTESVGVDDKRKVVIMPKK